VIFWVLDNVLFIVSNKWSSFLFSCILIFQKSFFEKANDILIMTCMHLLLAGNDTVPVLVRHGGAVHQMPSKLTAVLFSRPGYLRLPWDFKCQYAVHPICLHFVRLPQFQHCCSYNLELFPSSCLNVYLSLHILSLPKITVFSAGFLTHLVLFLSHPRFGFDWPLCVFVSYITYFLYYWDFRPVWQAYGVAQIWLPLFLLLFFMYTLWNLVIFMSFTWFSSICIVRWQYKQITEIDERKAVRFHTRHCKLTALRAWADIVASEKLAAEQNEVLAEQQNILWVFVICIATQIVQMSYCRIFQWRTMLNRWMSMAEQCIDFKNLPQQLTGPLTNMQQDKIYKTANSLHYRSWVSMFNM